MLHLIINQNSILNITIQCYTNKVHTIPYTRVAVEYEEQKLLLSIFIWSKTGFL